MEYWSQSPADVLKSLSSSGNGLSEEEVRKRQGEYGLNDIPKRREKSVFSLLFSELKDPLALALIVASIVSYITGGVPEAIIIVGIVVINTLVGFAQEYKSEKALQKLVNYITYDTKVFRDGKLVDVDTRNIVPGDIIFVETGDRIPADLRLLEAHDLEIDESLVTGESYPVHKIVSAIKEEKLEPQNIKNIAFMGTLVVNGKGTGIVISTGMKSTFGKIVGYLKSEDPETNYQKNIKNFSKFLIKAITIGVIFIFILNSISGYFNSAETAQKIIFDSALFSLALAVGIIPEALPVIVTVGLSRGAIRMGKAGVITKKLASIEDLGNMDVLCMDKTGTITENRISLVDYVDLCNKKDKELLEFASACTSVIEKNKRITGSPIDMGIIECMEKEQIGKKYETIDTIPFDYTRKRMGVVVKHGNDYLLVCKGAPESVISVCSKMKMPEGILDMDKAKIEMIYEDLFKKGYRVIAVATKTVEKKDNYKSDDEKGLTLIGFLSFMDPPKFTSKPSILSLEKLGVGIKILTGDHPLITKKVAEETGIIVTGMLTGREIDRMSDEELGKSVETTNIFARLTPDHKVRIVSALKKNGHVVGFLGDGVNDAPVLRYSDVGISVNSGVDIAKESADIILTRKSLSSILAGIVEGRKTFGNTTKYILNTISANIGNMSTLALVSPFLGFLPMLPPQILLTNLVSDGPLLAISTDKVDDEELKNPKNWNIKFIRNFSAFFGSISSIFDLVTMFLLLYLIVWPNWAFLTPPERTARIALFQTGWFIESALSEIFVTFAIRTRKRFFRSRPGKILVLTSILFAFLTLFIVYSPLGSFFSFAQLELSFLAIIAAILLTYFSVVEILKFLFYRKFSQAV